MTALHPALAEELAKALDDTYMDSDGLATSAEYIRALAPILSRALAEAWSEGFRAHHDFARGFRGITAPPNPYLTEKEKSNDGH